MRNLILTIIAITAFAISAAAQNPDPKYVYCTLKSQQRLLSTKVTVSIDFGDHMKVFVDRRLKDKRGKPIVFNSVVDALNFLGNRNWELIQAFAQINGDVNETVWIMKKSFLDLDDESKEEYRRSIKADEEGE